MKFIKKSGILFLLTSIIVLPFLYLFSQLNEESFSVFSSYLFSKTTFNTYLLIFITSLFSLIWAVPTAYLQSEYSFKNFKFLEWALILPLAIPSYILAYTYKGIFGPFGTTHSLLDFYFHIDNIYYLGFIFSLALYPYLYLILKSVFRYKNKRLIEASRILGYNKTKSFIKITLPIIVPSIIAGLSIVAMEILNNFGAVSYFGVKTYTTEIIKHWSPLNIEHSIGISLLLVIAVLIFYSLDYLYQRKKTFNEGLDNYSQEKNKASGKIYFFGIIIQSTPFILGFLLPIIQLFIWSSKVYKDVINADFINLISQTLLLAFKAVVICVFIAIIFTLTNRFQATKTNKFLTKLSTVGYALPGVIVAIAILQFGGFIQKSLSFYVLDYLPALLLTSYVIRFQTLSINTLESASIKIPQNYHESSRVLGFSFLKTLFKVDLPLLKTAILSSSLLVFVDITKELPLTMMFQTFNLETLAVRSYLLMMTDGAIMQSSVPSLIIVLIGIFPTILMIKLAQK